MSAAQHTPGPWSASKIEDRAAFNVFTPGRCSALLTLEPGKYDGADPRTSNVEADARLIAAAPELLAALLAYQTAEAMTRYGDYSDFVWPKVEMRKPGETAWGWICEKHGLGYQGGCICCSDEYQRHRDQKDREALYARDDALKAAKDIARAAIAKATGQEGGAA